MSPTPAEKEAVKQRFLDRLLGRTIVDVEISDTWPPQAQAFVESITLDDGTKISFSSGREIGEAPAAFIEPERQKYPGIRFGSMALGPFPEKDRHRGM